MSVVISVVGGDTYVIRSIFGVVVVAVFGTFVLGRHLSLLNGCFSMYPYVLTTARFDVFPTILLAAGG